MEEEIQRIRAMAAEAELLAAHLENMTAQHQRLTETVAAMGETINRVTRELGELRIELMKGTDK